MHKKPQMIALLFILVFSLIPLTTTYATSKGNAKSLQKEKPKIVMTATDKQLVVKSNKVKYATKYQYAYATNNNFKNAKKITTKSRNLTIKTKQNKNYYVKCRAIVKVKNKNYYSKWSVVKVKIITKKAWNKKVEQSKIVYSKSKRWDGLFVDTKTWVFESVARFHYDGYIAISEEDFCSYQKALADAGCDVSYSCPDISFPDSLTTTKQDLGEKNVRETTLWMTEFIVFNYDGYVPISFKDFVAHQLALKEGGLNHSYHTEEIDIETKTHIVHHKAKYKIETM